jgi:hypothetical protein
MESSGSMPLAEQASWRWPRTIAVAKLAMT